MALISKQLNAKKNTFEDPQCFQIHNLFGHFNVLIQREFYFFFVNKRAYGIHNFKNCTNDELINRTNSKKKQNQMFPQIRFSMIKPAMITRQKDQ